MTKILKFNTKTEKFKKWLNNCAKDFEKHPPKSALLLWETEDKNGQSCTYHSKYECGFENFVYFFNCLEDKYFEMRIEKYLTEPDEENL